MLLTAPKHAPTSHIERMDDTVILSTSRVFDSDLEKVVKQALHNDTPGNPPLRLELHFDPNISMASDDILCAIGIIHNWVLGDERRSASINSISSGVMPTIESTHFTDSNRLTFAPANHFKDNSVPDVRPTQTVAVPFLELPPTPAAVLPIPPFSIQRDGDHVKVAIRPSDENENHIGGAWGALQREQKEYGKADTLTVDLTSFNRLLASQKAGLLSMISCVSDTGRIIVRCTADSMITSVIAGFPPRLKDRFSVEIS